MSEWVTRSPIELFWTAKKIIQTMALKLKTNGFELIFPRTCDYVLYDRSVRGGRQACRSISEWLGGYWEYCILAISLLLRIGILHPGNILLLLRIGILNFNLKPGNILLLLRIGIFQPGNILLLRIGILAQYKYINIKRCCIIYLENWADNWEKEYRDLTIYIQN